MPFNNWKSDEDDSERKNSAVVLRNMSLKISKRQNYLHKLEKLANHILHKKLTSKNYDQTGLFKNGKFLYGISMKELLPTSSGNNDYRNWERSSLMTLLGSFSLSLCRRWATNQWYYNQENFYNTKTIEKELNWIKSTSRFQRKTRVIIDKNRYLQ